MLKSLARDDEATLESFEKKAQSRVHDFVELISGDGSAKTVADALRNTSIGKLRGDISEASYVVVMYNPKVASEYATQPHIRIPPLRKDSSAPGGNHYKNMIQAALESRSPADSEGCGDDITEGDCYVVSDAGKFGNHTALMSVFTDSQSRPMLKQVKSLQIFYDEQETLTNCAR